MSGSLVQPLYYQPSEQDWNNWMQQLTMWAQNQSVLTTGLPVTAQGIQDVVYNTENSSNISLLQIVPTLPQAGSFVGQFVYQESDDNLYTWNGTSWQHISAVFKGAWSATIQYYLGDEVAGSDSRLYIALQDSLAEDPTTSSGYWLALASGLTFGDIGGTIEASQIANATITGTMIDSATITGSNISNGTITGTQIASATITATQIANATITATQISGSAGITGSQIAAATISGANISTGTVTGANIAAATVSGANIAASTISGSNIQSLTITAAEIANLTITNNQIANGTIGSSQIATGGVDGSNVANATITATNIANGTITATQIANATVTGTNIANATITAAQISGTAGITGTQLANATITGTQIAAGTITASNIANATVTATQIANLTITASQIANLTINTPQIAANAVSNYGFIVDVAGSSATWPYTDSGTVQETMETVSYTSDGGWVEITATALVLISPAAGGTIATTFSLYMDGSQVGTMEQLVTQAQMSLLNGLPAFFYLSEFNVPAAGTHTYSLHASVALTAGSSGSAELQWTNTVLKVRELKK